MSKKKNKNENSALQEIEVYRVMLDNDNPDSLILSTDNLDKASELAASHHGYRVYDKNGNIKFDPWIKRIITEEQIKYIKAGGIITLNNTFTYAMADSVKPNGRYTGTFYYYDGKVINARTRITNIPTPDRTVKDIVGFIDIV